MVQSSLRLIIWVGHILVRWNLEGGSFSLSAKYFVWLFYYPDTNMVQMFTFLSIFEAYRRGTMYCNNEFNEKIHTPGNHIWCLVTHIKHVISKLINWTTLWCFTSRWSFIQSIKFSNMHLKGYFGLSIVFFIEKMVL